MRNVTACALVDLAEGRTPRLYHRPGRHAAGAAEPEIYNQLTAQPTAPKEPSNERTNPQKIPAHRRRNH